MSSRQEEKERRRQERMAAEQAAARSAARRKRMGLVLGGLLVAVVAGIVGFAVLGGDDSASGGAGAGAAAVPAVKTTDLDEAARIAGCRVNEHPVEGQDHTAEPVRYKTNPPTSGDHEETAAREGVYPQDGPPDVEQSVHALEHGRVLIQYRPGTPAQRVGQLQTIFEEEVKGIEGYKTLVFPNQTEMPSAVAATTWSRSLTCPDFNDNVFDAIRAFRKANVDKAPEANIPSEFGS